MSHSVPYTAEAITDHSDITDIRIHINGKTWHLWGRKGVEREATLAGNITDESLPILIGAGLGHCLQALLDRGLPVAVVDKESEIDRLTGLKEQFGTTPGVLWLDNDNPQDALNLLTDWQAKHGGKPLSPIPLPLYLRLNRDYYGALADTLKANAKTDFWSQSRYPKFQSVKPRILFFDSSYFLCGEILASLSRLEIEHRIVQLDRNETGSQAFIETLLKSVIDFKPDFVLTVNHFGLDQEGKLASLLENLGLPLASWFVDNPHLILHQFAHPGTDNTAIFTYDAGNLDQLRTKGFENVHYLPLATDPSRFKPGLSHGSPAEWTSNVSFVGNSMTTPVTNNLRDANLPDQLQQEYETVAREYGESGNVSVEDFLQKHRPDWHAALSLLPSPKNKLALESLITWEATRQYRLNCVKQTLKFNPLIVGDTGWASLLGATGWRHISGLDYYADLPRFYPLSTINFNCTSRQMIGAVNQRIFDIPACGGFVLTDYREQMEDLFDLDSDVVVYRDPDEIPGLIRQFIKDDVRRKKISYNARKRILAEHTYELRLQRLMAIMHATFSTIS